MMIINDLSADKKGQHVQIYHYNQTVDIVLRDPVTGGYMFYFANREWKDMYLNEKWVDALADSDGYALSKDILSTTALSTALDVRSAKTEKNDMYLLEEVSKALPSVAAAEIYLGFITSEKDSACMKNTPDLFAEGIYNGILAYYFG